MMETNLFTKLLTALIVILLGISSVNSTTLSNKRLCFDRECSVPVSLAKTLLPYHPNSRGLLGFNINAEVKVFSKSAGNRTDLWGVEINGVRGYVPKHMIREYKILQKNLEYEVATEHYDNTADDKADPSYASTETPAVEKTPQAPIESSTEQVVIDPDKITPSYEIVDGTTIHFNPSDKPSLQPEKSKEEIFSENHTGETSETPTEKVQPDKFIEEVPSEKLAEVVTSKKPAEEVSNDRSTDKTSIEKPAEEVSPENLSEKVSSAKDGEEVLLEKLVEEVSPEKITELSHELSEDRVEEEVPSHNTEEQPTLSVEPSLVSSTLNFVSSMFDSGSSTQDSEDEDDEDNDDRDEEEEEEQKEEQQEVEERKEEEKDVSITEEKQVENEEQKGAHDQAELEPSGDPSQSQQDTSGSSDAGKEIVTESPPAEEIKPDEAAPTISEKLPKTLELVTDEINIKKGTEEEPIISEKSTPVAEAQVAKKEEVAEPIQTNFEPPLLAETPLSSLSSQSKEDNFSHKEELKLDETISVEGKESKNVDANEYPVITPGGGETVDPVGEKNLSELSTDDTLTTVTPQFASDVTAESAAIPTESNDYLLSEIAQSVDQAGQLNTATERTWTVGDLLNNRNLLNVNDKIRYNTDESSSDVPVLSEIVPNKDETMFDSENTTKDEQLDTLLVNNEEVEKNDAVNDNVEKQDSSTPEGVCETDQYCSGNKIQREEDENEFSGDSVMDEQKKPRDYWESVMYVSITAFTTLLFSLGYYYIENSRRDSALIAKINKLERELMVATKENVILDENLQSTSTKLNNIEDQSFGSNEMVLTLKAELEASKRNNAELEDQVVTLEKELESASEAGLELERMLREVLSSHSDDNPLAKSIEDLQTRLNAQQAANESLTNALNLKVQENETISSNLADSIKKCEQFETEVKRLRDDIQKQSNMKIYMEQTMTDQIQRLESQFRTALEDKNTLRSELKEQEQKVKELSEVIKQYNVNNLDFEKLFEVAHVKAEVTKLTEERDELKIKLSEVEGAHQLLEEHVKIVDEQLATFTEQCKLAEKEKKDAETRLEVLSNFFKEKEAQRQKEEALWLEKQGEVASTVERIQTMQNEIQNYKQQVEMLKREIIDQEKEYKCQIAALETKSHEQWVLARQTERRLEESKAEASQLRFRLTMVEKNLNDSDSETKLHRLEANGETATSPALFLGAESSSSPIMFGSSGGGLPPPPPGPQNFMYAPPFAPFLPPPPHNFEAVGQRPAPLGGRLPSPPPMSPPLPSPYGRHRSPPPPPHYASEHPFHPPPLPHPSMLPLPMESLHPRAEESHIRNSAYSTGLQHHREQRTRNHHKGSLHSSGESLDKPHHNSKV